MTEHNTLYNENYNSYYVNNYPLLWKGPWAFCGTNSASRHVMERSIAYCMSV